jgi:hypothetical protein
MRASVVISIVLIFLAKTPAAMACATCFGASDSPMAQGMNWGIFSLLAVIIPVLAIIGGFFIFLARRSSQFSSAPEQFPTKNV